jgi:hypothetical protein
MTDRERVDEYSAQLREQLATVAPVIMMCDCTNWLTCKHPWPKIAPLMTPEIARLVTVSLRLRLPTLSEAASEDV